MNQSEANSFRSRPYLRLYKSPQFASTLERLFSMEKVWFDRFGFNPCMFDSLYENRV